MSNHGVISSETGPFATGSEADCRRCVSLVREGRAQAVLLDKGRFGVERVWSIMYCPDCEGTFRDPIPMTEVMKKGRYWQGKLTVTKS